MTLLDYQVCLKYGENIDWKSTWKAKKKKKKET